MGVRHGGSSQHFHITPWVAKRLIQASDLVWQGSFKLPEAGGGGGSTTSFSGGGPTRPNPGGIGFNPLGNSGQGSLFIEGITRGASLPNVSEVSIPSLSKSSNIANLTAAATLQGFGDITGGLGTLQNIDNVSSGNSYLGNIWIDGNSSSSTYGYCFWCGYNTYDNGPTYASHGYSTTPSNLASPGAHGMYKLNDSYSLTGIGGASVRFGAGYVHDIPAAWQGLFGGYTHFSGLCGPSIAANQQSGPGMLCFKAADFVGLSNNVGTTVQGVSARSYLFYPRDSNAPFNQYVCNPYWSNSIALNSGGLPWVSGGVFIDTPSLYGLVFFGHTYKNMAWYGYPSYADWFAVPSDEATGADIPPLVPGGTPYDTQYGTANWPSTDTGNNYWYDSTTYSSVTSSSQITSTGKSRGVNNDASQMAIWIYNPNDILSAANPYSPSPSQTLFDSTTSPNPWITNKTMPQPLGVAYDRANKTIYLVQALAYYANQFNGYPLVHVYSHA